jgi:hypothetical protein
MQIKNKKNPVKYSLSSNNIFDIIKQRITADKYGCSIVVPHVCNNIDVFNGGFAAAVASEYPIVKQNYHMLGKNFLKNNLGHTQFIEIPFKNKYNHKLYFANMIAQDGLPNYSKNRCINYAALVKSMINISLFIKKNNQNTDADKIEIHAPKFGSGIAGGNWNFISDIIEDVWSQYDIFIYQYNKGQQ